MQREDRLPYGIGQTIIDNPVGSWFLVYDQSEGFQPLFFAIMADDACSAEDVWAEQERNQETEQLVVIPLKRNIPLRDEETGRYLSADGPVDDRYLFSMGEMAY